MPTDRPDFPTMTEVEKASHEQLAAWFRFLATDDTNPERKKIMDRVEQRLKQKGGMTEKISDKIGYGGV